MYWADILAAGSALGRAGLWSDCLDFATESDSISLYGPVSVQLFLLFTTLIEVC